jgi:flagellar biosynthesis protein FliP
VARGVAEAVNPATLCTLVLEHGGGKEGLKATVVLLLLFHLLRLVPLLLIRLRPFFHLIVMLLVINTITAARRDRKLRKGHARSRAEVR